MASFEVTVDQINALTDEQALGLLGTTPVIPGPASVRQQQLQTLLQGYIGHGYLAPIDGIFARVFTLQQPLHTAMQENYIEDAKFQPLLEQALKGLDSISRTVFYIFRFFVHLAKVHADLYKPQAIPIVLHRAPHYTYGTETTMYYPLLGFSEQMKSSLDLLREVMISTIPLEYKSLATTRKGAASHKKYQMPVDQARYAHLYRQCFQPSFSTDLRAYVMLRAWRVWQTSLEPAQLMQYQQLYPGAPTTDVGLIQRVNDLLTLRISTLPILPVERSYFQYILRLLQNFRTRGSPQLYSGDLTPGDPIFGSLPLEMFGTMAGGTGDALHTLITEYGIPDDADIMERLSRMV